MDFDPLTLMLGAPLVIPAGLAVAAWGYPWRKPKLRPYLWYVLALLAPLGMIVVVQAIFALPAGSCVDRPLNFVPLVLAGLSLLLAVGLSCQATGFRRFVVGTALAAIPLTLFWSAVAAMSLAGCWI